MWDRDRELPGGKGAVRVIISESDCREGGRLGSGLVYELAMAIVQPKPGAFLPCAGQPFASLLYFTQSHVDVIQPNSCKGGSAHPYP